MSEHAGAADQSWRAGTGRRYEQARCIRWRLASLTCGQAGAKSGPRSEFTSEAWSYCKEGTGQSGWGVQTGSEEARVMFGTVLLRNMSVRAYSGPISAVERVQMKDIVLKMIPRVAIMPENRSEEGNWERKSRSVKMLWNVFFSRTVINYANSCNQFVSHASQDPLAAENFRQSR